MYRKLFLCLCATAGAVSVLPPSIRRGFASIGFGSDVLTDPNTLLGLKQMAVAGANWVSVEPVVSQAHVNSSVVVRSDDTTSDVALGTFITTAQGLGLSVMIKLLLTVDDGGSWIFANPVNTTSWFDSYTSILLHYAQLGQAAGVRTLCLGTELTHLAVHPQYAPYWKQAIAMIRSAAPSLELAYASLYVVEYPNVTFWQDLDVIGIDAYFPLTTAANPSPSVSDMLTAWDVHLSEVEAWRQSAGLASKPVVFTEIGYGSYTGCTVVPASIPETCTGQYASNFTAQADAYTALFETVANHSELVSGLMVFWIDNPSTWDYEDGGSKWPCFFTPRGKPAFEILATAYGGTTSSVLPA
jgi:hypothetical protein